MIIKIIDDGKSKHQSFEAILDEIESNEYGFYSINIVGYGEDEESSMESLKCQVDDLIYKLTNGIIK